MPVSYNSLTVKVYNGYGHTQSMVVYGHVFRNKPRIVRILEVFPNLKFILLSDNSQRDPQIYASIRHKYPGKITAVYIRNM